MNIHFVFDLAAAMAAMGTTFALSKGVLAPSLTKIEGMGPVYYIALLGGAIWGAFAIGTLNLWVSGVPEIGRSILGAFLGAVVMVELSKYITKTKGSTGALFVPAFTVSTIIGRWGCFFAGLPDQTFGIKTGFALGVDFGDGPRHPVQLYESAAMLVALLIWMYLIRHRPQVFRKYGFYFLCIFYGGQRFIWEFLKPYGTVFGPFNVFHICCAVLIGYGICMIAIARKQA